MSAAVELPQSQIRRLKRDEYDRLVDLGCFENERVELLYGMLVEMSPQKPPHSSAVRRLTRQFQRVCADGRADFLIQSPILAAGESEPEPDLALIPRREYGDAHPDEALLICEVAWSSHHVDRTIKTALYAESGFPEYWLVDLKGACVEVYRAPVDGRYTVASQHGEGDKIAAQAFPDVVIEVATLLG